MDSLAVLLAEAKDQGTPSSVLARLANYSSVDLRYWVAQNVNTPVDTLASWPLMLIRRCVGWWLLMVTLLLLR